MPIRLNLLSEDQAQEEMRRRDPVKRVILLGIVVVALMLAWSIWLVGQKMVRKSELTSLESSLNLGTNEYSQIIQKKNALDEGRLKLAALNRLTTNRFLIGSMLNALQQTTVEDVQLVRMRLNQTYTLTEEIKSKPTPGQVGKPAPPKPASATEHIVLTLNARDSSPLVGGGVKRLQDALSASPYFGKVLGRMSEFRLTFRGPPQTDSDGKTFILFTLEAQFPDKTR